MKRKNQSSPTNKFLKGQYGSQNILAEDGELFLDREGQLQEVRGFSHDDSFVELPNGQKAITSKGNGGQILDDATSVLSDSYTQVKEGDRKNSNKEQQVAIKSKDAKKLFDYKWFNAGKNKKYSPSELVKEVLKQRDKKLSQYSDVQQNDALTLSTNQLNASLMPNDEQVYDVILKNQEQSKGKNFNENLAQFGKKIPNQNTKSFLKKNQDTIFEGERVLNRKNEFNDVVGATTGEDVNVLDSFESNKELYRNYVNSDLYKNRIKNNTQRVVGLQDSEGGRNYYNNVGQNDLNDVSSGRLIKRINNLGINTELNQSGISGYYDKTNNTISVDKNQLNVLDDTVVHEIGHATSPSISNDYLLQGYDLQQRLNNSLQNNLKQSTTESMYFHTPGEIRSRIMELRGRLNNGGKSITEGNYTQEDLDKLKNEPTYQELKSVFSDDEIFELTNDLASNNSSSNINRAQYGGSTYVDKNKYDKINYNEIEDTMDNRFLYESLTNDKKPTINDVYSQKQRIDEYNQKLFSKYFNNKEGDLIVKDSKYNIRNNQKVNKAVINDIIEASLRSDVDPYTALAIAQRESGIGNFSYKDTKGTRKDFTPRGIFSNWESDLLNLTEEEWSGIGKTPYPREEYTSKKTFDKAKQYTDNALEYPFAAEMEVIKRKGIKGYNAGDKDYSNKVAREREILFSNENKEFREYVDDRVKSFKKQYGGIPVNPNGLYEEKGPVIIPSNNITMEKIPFEVDAYDADTNEYLTRMQPNMNYRFKNSKNIMEVPVIKAQIGYDNVSRIPDRRINIEGTDRTLNPEPYKPDHYVDQYGDVWKKEVNGEFTKTELRHQETLKPKPASYVEYMTGNDNKYEVRRGDWISSVAEAFGITEEKLLELNPEIGKTGKIIPGQRIEIGQNVKSTNQPTEVTPEITNLDNQPVDRSDEIDDIQELPEELDVQAEDVIPTLDVKAENVPSSGGLTTEQSKEIADKIRLGKIDRTQGTNALREMMRANRSINLPYRSEVPRRLYDYLEEDVTPYLDELDSQSTQALQNVNQNTAQGQAIAANILNRVGMNKRQIINRANSMNLQRRQQTDNANVQLQNQFDLMQEQGNKNYVDETYQTIANYDRNRVQQAEYLDDMINNNTRTNNFFTMENMRNPNYQIDPVTGEVFRIGTPFKQSKKQEEKKAQFGIKRKKNKMC